MNRRMVTYRILCCILLFTFLSACGGGGGGDAPGGTKTADTDTTPTVVSTLNGTVADGYLRGARVFLDRNENRLYDNGEPTGISAAGGLFALEVNPGDGDLYPVVVEVIAGQTVDEDTGLTIQSDYLLEALPGRWQFVSPLTTLVKIEMDKNPSYSELQAIIQVRSQLGIADSVSLFNDYLAFGVGGEQAIDPLSAEEYGRAHKAAQVVAAQLADLRESLAANIGGEIDPTEQLAVAYLVSDQILAQSDSIKLALDAERNGAATVDVAALIDSVSSAINPAELNTTLLTLYAQRISQALPTWDMQPPVLLNRTPPAGDTAPVDMVVGIEFDELLDETLLLDSLISLSGPSGYLPGSVGYDPTQKKLSFTPDQLLLPFSHYQVILSNELADSLGNSLGEDVSWSFTTIFDQTPPALPNF